MGFEVTEEANLGTTDSSADGAGGGVVTGGWIGCDTLRLSFAWDCMHGLMANHTSDARYIMERENCIYFYSASCEKCARFC